MNISKPVRASHTGTFTVAADADAVFALMCPVGEADWLESWHPVEVLSESGVVEPGCVFTSSDERGQTLWLVCDHDAATRHTRMVKMAPGFTACLLEITVDKVAANEARVTVTYTYTALSESGKQFVAGFNTEAYENLMQHWHDAIAYYLEHGRPMPGS